VGLFPERNGNARKIISRLSEKDRYDLTLFIPFLLIRDSLFDDPTSLEYIWKGFQVFLLYIRGKRYRPSNFNKCLFLESVSLLCFVTFNINAVSVSWFCAVRVAVCCICCVSCMNSSLSFI